MRMDTAVLPARGRAPRLGADRPNRASDPALPDRRAIVDRRALQVSLDALVGEGLTGGALRARVLQEVKRAVRHGQEEVRRRFFEGLSGAAAARASCFLADQVIRTLYDFTLSHVYPLANPSTGEAMALVAIGGYGRGELAPFSDIDLLFLLPYKLTPHSEQVVEYLLYLLWDAGFKVGHATRSVDECIRLARGDSTISTALLEARFLWGSQALYLDLKQRYAAEVQAGSGAEFIDAKLAERDQRHERLGASRYSLEPNIKDGKGGLRDLHTLFWIAKFIYRVDDVGLLIERGVFTRREVQRFAKAHAYLWTLRFHLHYLAGRPEERLTFDLQPEIGRRMGYTPHAGTKAVERFMKHYFLVAKDVGDLTRIFCAALEADHRRRRRRALDALGRRRTLDGFPLDLGRLTVAGPEVLRDDPTNMLRLFHVAQANNVDVHPAALRWITQNLKLIDGRMRRDPEANRLFMEILTSQSDPETWLRRLNEAGVFGRFVPDFGRVVAQMQFDHYHHYTVDEHTVFAIGVLHRIEQGQLKDEVPIASEVVHKVLSRRALYVAVLLHDIAKGRGGDHSEIGARIAQRLCPRLGMSAEETETVAWLVLHHLAMSNTAFKRDIDDPKTIQDFVDLVQSIERLRLLLVLTVADIRAVGPKVWNNWKAALLRELYYRAEEVLSGGLITEGREARVAAAVEALKARLADWPAEDIEAHVARGYPSYWLSVDQDKQVRDAHLVRAAERRGAPLTIDTRIDRYRGATEITLYTADQPGLFSRIAGAIALSGGTIEAARIFTLANGMALDSFWIRDAHGGPFDRADKLARLYAAIEQVLTGRLGPLKELQGRPQAFPSRLSVFRVEPRVLIDNSASRGYTVIEINARDRPGLLYVVTNALTKLNLQIHSAKISTYGERAVDAFYVNDILGSKIEAPARLKRIQTALLKALEQADGATEQARRDRKADKAKAARARS
jgi:[protein-PII] uridylyltransferase